MADRLDVAERLAEGRPAVERTETYLLACRRLGYHHPDLTSRPAQISDWYDSEEGLDLHALDSDCAQLRAACTAISEALRIQRAQVLELATAWAGPGADAAVRFLQRHCDGATTLATEVRAAAQRCESLRDNLWQLIDAKVATAVAIDDRTLAQRSLWSAAAGTVLSGAGERAGAEEVLRGQVMPYVDNDIRGDWLTAMNSTLAGVTASYDMVTDRLAAAPRACFEIAGDLGPAGALPGPHGRPRRKRQLYPPRACWTPCRRTRLPLRLRLRRRPPQPRPPRRRHRDWEPRWAMVRRLRSAVRVDSRKTAGWVNSPAELSMRWRTCWRRRPDRLPTPRFRRVRPCPTIPWVTTSPTMPNQTRRER
ncbi:putative conserved alanine and proline rich protein [Mycobacterium kansasii 732]|nr:putative conserved alanine and proline rich protein [Mycobacterium kansasii 732]